MTAPSETIPNPAGKPQAPASVGHPPAAQTPPPVPARTPAPQAQQPPAAQAQRVPTAPGATDSPAAGRSAQSAPDAPESPAPIAIEPVVLYRVHFRPEGETVGNRTRRSPAANEVGRTLMHFADPRPTDAMIETLSPDSFVDLARQPPRGGELLLLFLSDRAPDQDQWRREAEAWMDDEEDGFGPALRIGMDGGWVLWRPGRAVILAPHDRGEDLLAAVVDFAFHHDELLALERELAAQWPSLQEDLPLVHKVGRKELSRLPHVEQMTAITLDWRVRAARIEQRLGWPAPGLTPPARRLGEKLRSLAEIEDRLELLDGRIEVFEYDYEMINQRFSDYRHFRKELIAEILIVAMLAFDMTLMAVQFYLDYLAPGHGE